MRISQQRQLHYIRSCESDASLIYPFPSMTSTWKDLAANKKREQTASIPPDWLLSPSKLPPESQANVLDVPYTSGLLTEKEIEITDTIDVNVILNNLARAIWSSIDVTTAFYKRAIIAQQMVGHYFWYYCFTA